MSMIKPLNRRTFLQGTGSLIALPFLEAMIPLRAEAQMAAPLRLASFYFPFGVYKQSWAPSTYGANFNIPTNLEPITPYRSRLILTRGIGNYSPDYLGSHMAAPPCFTTGLDPAKGGELRVGDKSADMKISDFLRQKNPTLRPLMMAPQAAQYPPGGVFNNYAGGFMAKLSWVNTTTSASLTTSPQQVFDMLFSGAQTPTQMTDPMVQFRMARGKSVLDAVLGQANSLVAKVGASDKQKLDQFFTSARELEKSIAAANAAAPKATAPTCAPGTRPGTGMAFDQEVKAYLDLAVLAMACDKSRVITHFMDIEANVEERVPRWLGLTGANHHIYSHYASDQGGNYGPYMQITNWYAKQLAYFLGRLQAFKEGDKDLLYNSIIVFGSGMGDGSDHNTYNLPLVIAGEGGGQVKTGQGINAPNTPMSNMWLSIMRKFGMTDAKHGDSNGLLNI
jgi:hypothetical protein